MVADFGCRRRPCRQVGQCLAGSRRVWARQALITRLPNSQVGCGSHGCVVASSAETGIGLANSVATTSALNDRFMGPAPFPVQPAAMRLSQPDSQTQSAAETSPSRICRHRPIERLRFWRQVRRSRPNPCSARRSRSKPCPRHCPDLPVCPMPDWKPVSQPMDRRAPARPRRPRFHPDDAAGFRGSNRRG
jgi:hypothetical protein